MLPLLLNTAMDSILKSRFDKYRVKNTFPPEMLKLTELGIKPFPEIEKLNDWRENLTTLRVTDEKIGYILQGKIDDVFEEFDGRLIPADYKSSGNAPAEDKQKYYTDQLAAYGYMFQRAGYQVSDRAYLLHYFVKDKKDGALDVTFDSHLDLVEINLDYIAQKLIDMVKLLNNSYPGHNENCQKCLYYSGRSELLTGLAEKE